MVKPVIVRRDTKGSSLTHTEVDTNFQNLRDATIGVRAGSGGTLVTLDLNSSITLVAGSNVTLSGDNSAKTVTINAPVAGSTASDVLINAADSTRVDPAYLALVGGTSGAQEIYVDTGMTYSWVNDRLTVTDLSATTATITTATITTVQTALVDASSSQAVIKGNGVLLKDDNLANGEMDITISDTLSRIETKQGTLVINTNHSSGLAEFITLTGDGSNIHLKAEDGDGYVLISCGAGGVLRLSPITTTERNARTVVFDGMIIYNSTLGKFQGRAAGSWVDLH